MVDDPCKINLPLFFCEFILAKVKLGSTHSHPPVLIVIIAEQFLELCLSQSHFCAAHLSAISDSQLKCIWAFPAWLWLSWILAPVLQSLTSRPQGCFLCCIFWHIQLITILEENPLSRRIAKSRLHSTSIPKICLWFVQAIGMHKSR